MKKRGHHQQLQTAIDGSKVIDQTVNELRFLATSRSIPWKVLRSEPNFSVFYYDDGIPERYYISIPFFKTIP